MKERSIHIGPRNLYIADWHYGHANVIGHDNRPFQTLAEMNEALVIRWNDAVRPEDTVYILGDMFWCCAREAVGVLRTLNGKKVLIKGDHDGNTRDSEFCKEFEHTADYLEIEDGWQTVVLCHYPIPSFHLHFQEDRCHLYGHVHNTFEWNMTERFKIAMEELGHSCEMYNAGAMMPWMDYTPRTLGDIISGAAHFDIRMKKERPHIKTHLLIEGAKRYRDGQTGQEYRFEWMQFWEAACAAAEESSIHKVEVRLAEAAHISKEAVHDHLRLRGSYDASFPADIGIIRSYGTVLMGDGDAFLRPLVPAELPPPTSTAEELRRRGKRIREDLEYGLEAMEYEDSMRRVILDVFTALWDILIFYEISDGYNCRPDTGSLEGAEEYFGAMLESTRETVGRLEAPRNAPGPLYHRWQLNRLLRLIDETDLFVKSYSVPGVTLRWRRINPRLNYYDPVFDMVEELSPEVWRRLWYMFGYRPTKWDFQMREQYFSGQKEQREHFQRELVDTLEKLFHNDFFADH